MRKVLTFLALFSVFLGHLVAQTAFTPGDIFRGTTNRIDRIPLGGGDFTGAPAFATGGVTPYGQIVWQPDLTVAYFTDYGTGQINTLSPSGSVSVFASGLFEPLGLVWTSDNRLLAVDRRGIGFIRDITAGGNVSEAPIFASGLPKLRNLLQTSDGRILATLQDAHQVMDVTAGGDFTDAVPFATLPSYVNYLLEDSSGRILCNCYAVPGQGVYDITDGGLFSAEQAFATGTNFIALADVGGLLLAASYDDRSEIRDITAGGPWSEAPVYASGLTGVADTLMASVPGLPEPSFAVQTTVLVAKGDAVPGAGGSIVAAGSKFRTVGIPALNNSGFYAFAGVWVEQRPRHGVFVLDAYDPEYTAEPIAASGQPAPGADGATFSTFREPLISDDGRVAFLATLAGAPRAQQQALFTNADGDVRLVVRAGSLAPGTDGATFKKIQSVSLGRNPQEGRAPIFFTATLTAGTGFPTVRRGNDFGLWVWRGEEPELVLRNGSIAYSGGGGGGEGEGEGGEGEGEGGEGEGEGGEGEGEGGEATPVSVKFFSAITARRSGGTSTSGQGHGSEQDGINYIWTRIQTTNGVRSIGYVDIFGDLTLPYQRGEEAPGYGPGTTFKLFNLPTQNTNTSGAFLAQVRGGGVNASNDVAIFAEDEDFVLRKIVSTGDEVYDVPGATFARLRDPVTGFGLNTAFTARMAGGKMTKATDDALFYAEECGCIDLVAREGDQPPGFPEGARFRAFTDLALPPFPIIGPIFTAQAVVPKGAEPNPAQITRSNDTGFWMTDPLLHPRLAIREGQTMDIRGKTKIVRSFKPLAIVPGSPAQTRSHNEAGQIVYLVVFTDTSTAIVRSELQVSFGSGPGSGPPARSAR